MLTTLDHAVVAVADLDRATETYSALFGLSPSWHGAHPTFGTANTLFRLHNTYVELLAAAGEGAVGDFVRGHIGEQGEGPLAIALGTADAVGAAAELRSRGIDCGEPLEGEGREQATGVSRRWLSTMLPVARTRGVPLLVIQHLSEANLLKPAVLVDPAAADSAVAGVDHVVLVSSDADAAIALYRDALGLRLALDRKFERRGVRLLFFRVGGITLECAVPISAGAASVVGAQPPVGTDRFWGISYRVADVAGARERLLRAGFDVSEARTGLKPGTSVCTVRKETHGVATLMIGPSDSSSPAAE